MFKYIFVMLILVVPMFSSAGYDHGTSTGKGQLELDFTWNPFNLIEFGESYIVGGYGLTNRLDVHGYFSQQNDKQYDYYMGLFYQFADTKYLDLSTAVGVRQYTVSEVKELFFPQLLFNVKCYKDFSVGGAFVNVMRETNKDQRVTFDIALFVPLSRILKLSKSVPEIKLVLGARNRYLFDPERSTFIPNYSFDVTFKKFFLKNLITNKILNRDQ